MVVCMNRDWSYYDVLPFNDSCNGGGSEGEGEVRVGVGVG